jgi:hypothetical protein
VRAVLAETFGIAVPNDAALDTALAKLLA